MNGRSAGAVPAAQLGLLSVLADVDTPAQTVPPRKASELKQVLRAVNRNTAWW